MVRKLEFLKPDNSQVSFSFWQEWKNAIIPVLNVV